MNNRDIYSDWKAFKHKRMDDAAWVAALDALAAGADLFLTVRRLRLAVRANFEVADTTNARRVARLKQQR